MNKKEILKILGEVVHKLRDKNGYSINKLAYAYGLEKSMLSELEKGIREPKLITLWKLAEALNIKLSVLVKILEDELGEDFSIIDK